MYEYLMAGGTPKREVQRTPAGAFLSSDAVLCSDDDEFLDYEQGIPHFKGFPGRVVKAETTGTFQVEV